ALMTPSTCWNTPWTPQKHPPATTATSGLAAPAGSSTAGGGIFRASSAVEVEAAKPAIAVRPKMARAATPKRGWKDEIMGSVSQIPHARRQSTPVEQTNLLRLLRLSRPDVTIVAQLFDPIATASDATRAES